MEGMREYEVVRDGNVFGSSFTNSIVFSSDYDKARHQLNELVARYQNIPFNEVFSGSEIFNQSGVCFLQKAGVLLKSLQWIVTDYGLKS